MEIIAYTFAPGNCRDCGEAPRVVGTKVTCTDPQCWHGRYWHPLVTWPRKRVIDWQTTLPCLVTVVAVVIFALLMSYAALAFILGGVV